MIDHFALLAKKQLILIPKQKCNMDEVFVPSHACSPEFLEYLHRMEEEDSVYKWVKSHRQLQAVCDMAECHSFSAVCEIGCHEMSPKQVMAREFFPFFVDICFVSLTGLGRTTDYTLYHLLRLVVTSAVVKGYRGIFQSRVLRTSLRVVVMNHAVSAGTIHPSISMTKIDLHDDESDTNRAFLPDNVFLFMGRRGEKVIEKKAQAADTIVIVTGFLVSFAMNNIFTTDAHNFKYLSAFNVYVIFLSIAVALGFGIMIALALLSQKIRMLLGSSMLSFGEEEGADVMREYYGDSEWQRGKHLHDRHGEVRFDARDWFYSHSSLDYKKKRRRFSSPYVVYKFCMRLFPLMCAAMAIGFCARVVDVASSSVATAAIVIMTVTFTLSIMVLHLNGSLYDVA